MRVRLVVLGFVVLAAAVVLSGVMLSRGGPEVAEAPAEVVEAVAEETEPAAADVGEAVEAVAAETVEVVEEVEKSEEPVEGAAGSEVQEGEAAPAVEAEPPGDEEAPPTCENGIAVPRPEENPKLVGDCAILLSIRDVLAGEASLNWDAGRPIAEWDGVTIDGEPARVCKLDLASAGLTGRIPPELGDLVGLQQLRLGNNQLRGAIPAELGRLRNLRFLGLNHNRLRGSIPAGLGSLGNLGHLGLSHNQLSGRIPAELASLLELSDLRLAHNELTGAIPREFVHLQHLHTLYLEGNAGLTGCVPLLLRWVLRYELEELGLPDCEADPTLTCESGIAVRAPADNPGLVDDCAILLAVKETLIGDMGATWDPTQTWTAETPMGKWWGVGIGGTPARVQVLGLGSRGLRGRIPPELGGLTALRELRLAGNFLTGSIPTEIGLLRNLEFMWLGINELTGPIPAELGFLQALEYLWLGNNRLTGAIPAELGSLANLLELELDNNQLTGPIPAELGSLANLRKLWLQTNQLSGAIPAELGSLRSVESLLLYENQLTGAIPATLGSLGNLKYLGLSQNQLSGPIPAELGLLTNLESLSLDHNQLSGGIPPELGSLANLGSLLLNGNRLTGAIPPALSSLDELSNLYLQDNLLSGPIPAELGSLERLWKLYLNGNQLTGPIPAELGSLDSLSILRLDGNRLTGAIPAELGSLRGLGDLRLSDNDLTGAIPAGLGILSDGWHQSGHLGTLSLAGNAGLTGCIPRGLWHVARNDLAAIGLPSCGTAVMPPPPAPTAAAPPTVPADRSIVLPYNRWDTRGQVTTPSSYVFLADLTRTASDDPTIGERRGVIRTYRGLHGWAAGLRIHEVDADGVSQAAFYDSVTAGDTFERRTADDCWARYQVTAEEPPRFPWPNEPASRRDFAIRRVASVDVGCTESITADTEMSFVWHPPEQFLSPGITTPVRYGPYLLIPEGWAGAMPELREYQRPPWEPEPEEPSDRPYYAGWPTTDPTKARQHPLWREPELPVGWTLRSAWTQERVVEAHYQDTAGFDRVHIWVARQRWRPRDVIIRRASEPGAFAETRRIDGRVAVLQSDRLGTTVHLFDHRTATENFVHLYSIAEDRYGRGVEDAIAVMLSLLRDQAGPTVLSYNRLDLTGEVREPGSYVLLDGAGSAAETYEGLRDGTVVGLRIHLIDAGGRGRSRLYDAVAAGDLVEWRAPGDCWVRYEVTSAPTPADGAATRDFAVKWVAYGFTGCSGTVATDTAVTFAWHPEPNVLSPRITTPVRYGPYQIVPHHWTGATEEAVNVTPPASEAAGTSGDSTEPTWPSDDPTEVRQHRLWNEPTVPTGWTLGEVRAGSAYLWMSYSANGASAADITVSQTSTRPVSWISGLHGTEEARRIDGHTAILETSFVGSGVWILDEATGIQYFVYVHHTDAPHRPDIDDAIAVARSLYR